jgi:hypothetical protein
MLRLPAAAAALSPSPLAWRLQGHADARSAAPTASSTRSLPPSYGMRAWPPPFTVHVGPLSIISRKINSG